MKKHYKLSKRISILLISFLITLTTYSNTYSNNKESIAVINIGADGLKIQMPLITSLVTLELERIGKYEVIDKYDVVNHMKENKIALNQSYGKTDLIRIGKLLKVEKVLSGSAEKFGNKIIVVLRLIGVENEKIEKVNVMEYLDQEEDIQIMIRISLHNILGIENDQNTVEMLSNVNLPLANTRSKVNLSGPRFGMVATFGEAGTRLQASKDVGGFNMYPVNSLFGYQFEKQYVAAGEFQALFEVIPALTGLESGYIIPSVSLINGFRFNKHGFEFGIGPVFRVIQMSEGYFDSNGDWILKGEVPDPPADVEYIHQLDHRGSIKLTTGLIIAAGYTFKSGHINFPVNLYISPNKDGTTVGLVFGFNIARSKKVNK